MASRLTVVVSQASNRMSLAGDLEETLVAELMMTNGVDATMVGPLEHIQRADTDCLCLSSFNHSYVIVSALSTEEVQRNWDRLGLHGQVVPAGQVTNASRDSRRIFHVALQPDSQVSEMMRRVKEIYEDRNVKTVTIGGVSAAAESQPDSAGANVLNLSSRESSSENNGGEVAASSRSKSPMPAESESKTSAGAGRTNGVRPSLDHEDADEEQWQHLDQLVDDLDELDL